MTGWAGRGRQSAVQEALLEWVNSFPLSEKIKSLDRLNDGQAIWGILQDINPAYFGGNLPEGPSTPGSWVSRWQNLKYISKTLRSYVTDELHNTMPRGPEWTDLKLLATDSNSVETTKAGLQNGDVDQTNTDYTIQLLKLILFAALNSPRIEQYVQNMQDLSTDSQLALKEIIEEINGRNGEDDNADNPQLRKDLSDDTTISYNKSLGPTLGNTADPELLKEEIYGKLAAENTNLKQQIGLHEQQIEKLQENNHDLKEELVETQNRVKLNGSTIGLHGNKMIEDFQTRLKEADEYIVKLEGQLTQSQAKTNDLEKEADTLRRSHEKTQPLKDQIDELKSEIAILAKKANTVDKFKQKLQANQNLERNFQILRVERDEQSNELEKTRQQMGDLQQAVYEYKSSLSGSEQACHEMRMVKNQLEYDNTALVQRCESAIQEKSRYKELSAVLEARLGGLEVPATPGPDTYRGLENELEDSIEHDDEVQVALSLVMWTRLTYIGRNVDLRKKTQELTKSLTASDAQTKALQQRLDDVNQRHEELRRKYIETGQQKLMFESSMATLKNGHAIEGSSYPPGIVRAFTHEHDSTEIYHKLLNQIKGHQKIITELEGRLAATEEELRVAKIQRKHSPSSALVLDVNGMEVSLVDKSETEAFDILNEINCEELERLRMKNFELQQEVESLRTDLNDNRTMLFNALERKKTSADMVESTKNLQDTLDLIRASTVGFVPKDKNSMDKHISELADAITKGRDSLAKRQEQLDEQNIKIANLEKRLRTAEEAQTLTLPPEPKVAPQDPVRTPLAVAFSDIGTINTNDEQSSTNSQLENLKRENRLIMTAFYDLASRMQMSQVVLQRRSEVPRSFLNRQRQAVNLATAVRSR